MSILEALKDVVENKKTAILKSGNIILLFKDGLLMEASGTGGSREEIVKKLIEENENDVTIMEIDPKSIISLHEPIDISNLIPAPAGRNINIDPIMDSKIDAALMMISQPKAIIAARKGGDILSIKLLDEEKAIELAEKAEDIMDKLTELSEGNIRDVITILDNGTAYIKTLDNDRYVLVLTGDNSNIGIIRAALAAL